ncbi:hypothetical protein HX792_14330 [Pseudomonas sp. B6002]|uniref:hypothetical protein n=1 Tax=Pseudomonas sp. B6002 TaxID=2726978 RepID=UPI0015A16CE8|nr:hypothetical protein [Pseudomonas sp. B6002]NVZ51519.1 hypothetical protein [Pseudomonas sp. B6002]
MPLPLIGPKPYFYNVNNPAPAPYAVSIPQNSIILVWPLTTAIIQILLAGNVATVTLQKSGNGPAGPYPRQQAHRRVLDQVSINHLQSTKALMLEMRDLGPFRLGTNHVLRIEITDSANQVFALSTNLTVVFN